MICYLWHMAKTGRRRQDHLARKAQSQGYHARSVYKLEAIQKKHRLLSPGKKVLDLGAAPGSWTQYALEVAGAGHVLAVDLQEMALAGATCLQGDFTAPALAEAISAWGPFQTVLSDAAPATTGNRLIDTGRSEALVESILDYLPQWLSSRGNFAAKIFQGGGEQALLGQLRQRFSSAALYRPEAVRRESFEAYLIGIGYGGAG
ncbi:23S rRNA Um-2552 2'-O-methyltransferase [Alkalispirochaeta americana]|uniref:Ribosomal RNA large subunit methyltransferase E n=1 Tax=Alkalispirochaeta americana TaxID=159291 RepID=A0A1N6QGU0_9SPIO|nr:RlmE family RNA methyltransferase [Alkalispirochaeta americana]SIQ15732.1 23S rRNA Um-2552 2'-O-methyltransferase [Alkalispirochaeta americana]